MKIPKRNSKKYREILELGCQLQSTETDCGTEYDCMAYDWDCDHCPIVIELEREKHDLG